MRAVNLLPRDEGRRSDARKPPSPPILAGVIGGVLLAAGLTLGTLSAGGSLGEKQSELDNLNVQLAVAPRPKPGATADEVALGEQRTARAAALASALSRRVSWDRVLRRFSLVLPDDVWLTSLSLTAPTLATAPAGATPPPDAAPSGFLMVGYTYSHEAVARLLSRLAVVPDLANVTLQGSSKAELAGREVVSFTIVASIRSGSAPA